MMKKQFMVKEVLPSGDALLIPFDKDGCAGCGGSCSGCRVVITAKNKKNLPIRVGCLVSLNYATSFQKVFNVCTLVLPIVCAILCFVFTKPLAQLFHLPLTENFKSVATLLGFFIPAILLFVCTKYAKSLTELQITQSSLSS